MLADGRHWRQGWFEIAVVTGRLEAGHNTLRRLCRNDPIECLELGVIPDIFHVIHVGEGNLGSIQLLDYLLGAE